MPKADKVVKYIDGERYTSITFNTNSDTVVIESCMDDEKPVSLFMTKNELLYAISFFQAETRMDALRGEMVVGIA